MKFYNRTQELNILGRTWEQSKQSACFTVMVGRRRIGKTSLLLESVKGDEISLLIRISHQRAAFMPTISERCGRSTGNTDIRNDYPIQGSV